jgi:multidrug efflux pump subunit AcrB
VTLLIVITLLVIQLQSFSRLFLVLAVVPMGLIGLVGALLLFNRALGFVSTIFWGPMAFAIMGGLLVATVLTLIFLPALYVACFRVKEPRTDGSKP